LSRDHVPPARHLVDLATFAEHAAVSTATIRRWIHNGTLPAYRLPSTGGVRPGVLRLDLRDLELVVRRERVQS
jgi:excisionase family DNA binding protein